MEQAFAKIKHWLRAVQKRLEDAWRHIGNLAARECG
jgi:putative transposase